jgi:rare lipoprotein A
MASSLLPLHGTAESEQMTGLRQLTLATILIAALTACVTEVHEYHTRIAETKIHTEQMDEGRGFNFRTIAGPLQTTSTAHRRQTSRTFQTPLLRDYSQPDPNLVSPASVEPRFETYSRIGNKDYEVFGQSYKVWRDIEQYSEEGTASWYGPGFHGQYTANGETYNQYEISAAHKHLPIPCYVRVINQDNGRSLIVRVNDRGPFHDDRILDLSFGAAQQLGIVGQGIAKVRLDLIQAPRPANAKELIARSEAKTIQLLATNSVQQARQEARRLSQKFDTPITILSTTNQVYRLQIGPMAPQQADQMLTAIKNAGLNNAYFVY